MTRKKEIKRLMALGIQRNDAAGFVTTVRTMKAAGKERLLPGVFMIPEVKPLRTDYQLRRFQTTMRFSDRDYFRRVPADLNDQYIHKELAREIGLALLDAGAITITVEELPPNMWDNARTVEYRGNVTVVKEGLL